MYLGEYSHNLDDKGRLTLPARWRELLGERVVVTRGMERCLLVFTVDDFEKFVREATAVGMTGADARGLSRYFSSKATDDTPDKQGRISIPQALREHAGLNGEVTVVGAFDHIELWNPGLYAQADAELAKNVPDMSERVNQALQHMREK
jgi:MraZ protein